MNLDKAVLNLNNSKFDVKTLEDLRHLVARLMTDADEKLTSVFFEVEKNKIESEINSLSLVSNFLDQKLYELGDK